MSKTRTISALTFVFAAALVGCEEQPKIVQHKVPKDRSELGRLRDMDSFLAGAAAQKEMGSQAGINLFPVPDGWERMPPAIPSDKFAKTVNGHELTFSISVLPAQNEWIDNIQRWQGQVSLELTVDQIMEQTTTTSVDGIESNRIFLRKEEDDSVAILGVMTVKGSSAWFMKMMGNKGAIETSEAEFDDYIASIKIP